MIDVELIKKYFYTTNYIALSCMYLNKYKKYDELKLEDLKNYNPGHLGSSMNINFILSNLNYFLNKNKLTSKTIIGTGHSGVSLLSNLYLNGTLSKYYNKYKTTNIGLNNLINDFGERIRSEINPEYPTTIYDGGELGYSLSNAYGYGIDSNADVIPCIIGDGEAEEGTLSSSWYLNKLLNTKSKILPIINLNNYKMGTNSYLSRLTNIELKDFFSALGYKVFILDVEDYNLIEEVIEEFQNILNKSLNITSPLIILKSPKGYTIPDLENIKVENNVSSHKNPLIDLNKEEKLGIIKKYLEKYYYEIFENGELIDDFIKYFRIKDSVDNNKEIILPNQDNNNFNITNIEIIENHLLEILKNNNFTIFSPDEIYSNKLGRISKYCFEMLNEKVLNGLMQGYINAGNNSIFIGYEGFMPIISSMMSQYYKYLYQKNNMKLKNDSNSINYVLTSTCWENTYSHQNPGFVNDLLMKDDKYYNVLYPKDANSFINCINEVLKSKDKINIITISKRGNEKYNDDNNTTIDVIYDTLNPDIILCATGDYMLFHIKRLTQVLLHERPNLKIKIVYVTNPKILDINSRKSLSAEEFKYYFNENIPVIYLFNGYSNIIKSLLYERNVFFRIYGYNDKVSTFGGINENLNSNGLSLDTLSNICFKEIDKNSKILKLRRENGK